MSEGMLTAARCYGYCCNLCNWCSSDDRVGSMREGNGAVGMSLVGLRND